MKMVFSACPPCGQGQTPMGQLMVSIAQIGVTTVLAFLEEKDLLLEQTAVGSVKMLRDATHHSELCVSTGSDKAV